MVNIELEKRPSSGEHADYFGTYIGRVGDGSIVESMQAQIAEFQSVFSEVDDVTASEIHAPYTWTIKQVVGHLIDVERVFSYRALRFAANDLRPILGMEHDQWMENSDFSSPSLAELTEELTLVRRSNLCLFQRIEAAAWDRIGDVDGNPMSVRAIAWCLTGHIIHHLEIIKTRVSEKITV